MSITWTIHDLLPSMLLYCLKICLLFVAKKVERESPLLFFTMRPRANGFLLQWSVKHVIVKDVIHDLTQEYKWFYTSAPWCKFNTKIYSAMMLIVAIFWNVVNILKLKLKMTKMKTKSSSAYGFKQGLKYIYISTYNQHTSMTYF